MLFEEEAYRGVVRAEEAFVRLQCQLVAREHADEELHLVIGALVDADALVIELLLNEVVRLFERLAVALDDHHDAEVGMDENLAVGSDVVHEVLDVLCRHLVAGVLDILLAVVVGL